MVQAFIIYYGVAQVLKPTGFSWSEIGGAFTAGAVTLSLNSGAYMAEIIRGGIEAVDIRTDGSSKKFRAFLYTIFKKSYSSTGISHYASFNNKSMYNFLKRYINFICNWDKGAYNERKNSCSKLNITCNDNLDSYSNILFRSLLFSFSWSKIFGGEIKIWKIKS